MEIKENLSPWRLGGKAQYLCIFLKENIDIVLFVSICYNGFRGVLVWRETLTKTGRGAKGVYLG